MMDENTKRLHRGTLGSFKAAMAQANADLAQAQADGDAAGEQRAVAQMAGLRASMRELDMMAAEVSQPQRRQQVAVNEYGLTEDQDEIALKSFTAPDMTDDQKRKLYISNINKLADLRASGKYPQFNMEEK